MQKLKVTMIDCTMMERMDMHDNNSPERTEDFMEYTPTRLLDTLIETLQLRNDSQLCRLLDVAPPVISKIRNSRMSVGASMLIRMHDASGISIADLRYLMGDRRGKFRFTHPQSRFTEDS